MKPVATIVLLLSSLLATVAMAAVREEQVNLPVEVVDGYGKSIAQVIKVTVFSDDTNPRPAPVMVINHGRATDAVGRASLGRARYADISRFFVQQGFVVAVPTRIGYGDSGGEDLEETGDCSRKNFPPAFAAAARETLAVLEMARQRPDTAKDRAVIVGQSFGGAIAVATASLNPPGVQASVNFAGGGGGNPKTQAQRPCSPQQLERTYGGYGKTAKVPMLWIYTENDMYFGPRYPKEWFDAYVKGGAPAQFVQFPPHGEDGHSLFTRFPDVWKPKVMEFLAAQGFKAPASKGIQ
ncbi:MAG TPA: dienelactone hydrolase family protein [Ramlibacter sp.]|nr:dienelactone hydrolase family protein [Ramlibacter sp.]